MRCLAGVEIQFVVCSESQNYKEDFCCWYIQFVVIYNINCKANSLFADHVLCLEQKKFSKKCTGIYWLRLLSATPVTCSFRSDNFANIEIYWYLQTSIWQKLYSSLAVSLWHKTCSWLILFQFVVVFFIIKGRFQCLL